MKIIITENQMDKFIQKMKMSIKKYGFVDTANMLGIDKLKLAELSGLPIKGDTFHSENEIVVGDLLRDLVNQNKEYKNCTLHYSGLEGVVLWDCNLWMKKTIIDYLFMLHHIGMVKIVLQLIYLILK